MDQLAGAGIELVVPLLVPGANPDRTDAANRGKRVDRQSPGDGLAEPNFLGEQDTLVVFTEELIAVEDIDDTVAIGVVAGLDGSCRRVLCGHDR